MIHDRFWRNLLLLWIIVLLLSGWPALPGPGSADTVSTSVSADGHLLSTSLFSTDEAEIVSRILGTGRTSIDRETGTGDFPSSSLQAASGGTLLISEYAGTDRQPDTTIPGCVFGNRSGTGKVETAMSRSAGILQQGTYARDQYLSTGSLLVSANGTGLFGLSHRIEGNQTLSGRTVASGNLSIRELIEKEPEPGEG